MQNRPCLLLGVLLGMAFQLEAQSSTVYTEPNLAYHRGIELFNQGLFGLAQQELETAILGLRPVNEPEWQEVKTSAALHYVRCAVRLDQPDAEKRALDFLRDQVPDPIAGQAALEIGDHYFNKKAYPKALVYYEMAPATGATRDELRFKTGYSYFVTKKFAAAKSIFGSLKEQPKSKFMEEATYYYGCCCFYEKRYEDAQKAFQRCESFKKYELVVPYYLTQILFARNQIDEVIRYGVPKANIKEMRNQAEISQLVGQAYFQKEDYTNAQKYLEFAAKMNATFDASSFYQLGFAQYKNGFYKQAIENFVQLSKKDSLLGQNALYHLGDSYLKTNNKMAARNAFGQASSVKYNPSIQEAALMNYAKLSWELKQDRDALKAFQQFSPNSPYYDEAQALMGEVYLNTRDYDRAVAALESVKNRSTRLNEIYQKVTYLRGLQLYQTNQKSEASRFFNKSIDYPIDRRILTLCSYWLGTMAHEEGQYDKSIQQLRAFLQQAGKYNDLPEESSLPMGNYVQGYNYLKKKDYDSAFDHFKSCVDGIKKNSSKINNSNISSGVLGDAFLRAGDCLLAQQLYTQALSYYNEAISKKSGEFEYAIFQKGMIQGLQDNHQEKIKTLESLVTNYPNSTQVDEALFQIGITYLTKLNNTSQSAAAFKKIVQEFRGRSKLIASSLNYLGYLSYNQGDRNAAIQHFKQVFSNNPTQAEAELAEGRLRDIYAEKNQIDEFVAFIESIPGRKISDVGRDTLTFHAAEYHFNVEDYQKAIDGFNNYLLKYPNGRESVKAYYLRGESNLQLQKNNEALKDYIAVTNRGASLYFPAAAETGARLAMNPIKDYSRALELGKKWEESATNTQSRFDAQLLLMEAAFLSNNSTAGQEYANKVVQSNLGTSEQQAKAHLFLGKIAYNRGDLSTAMTSFQKVTRLSQSESMAEGYHYILRVLFDQRKYDDVEALLETATLESAGQDDWIARNYLIAADASAKKGDVQNAKIILESILEGYTGGAPDILSTARQKYIELGGIPTDDPTPQSRSIPKPGKVEVLELETGN